MTAGRGPRLVRVEQLLGTMVRDPAGRRVGRIEEITAEARGEECLVTSYLVGLYAVLDRLAAWALGRFVLARLRLPATRREIPWRHLDLADPARPRLTCSLAALEALGCRDAPERPPVSA